MPSEAARGNRSSRWSACIALACCALVLDACSAISDFDYSFGPKADAGTENDGGAGTRGGGGRGGSGGRGGGSGSGVGDGGGGLGAVAPRPLVLEVGGGGQIASKRYKLRVTLGAPQPMGHAQSNSFGVRLGPHAGRE